MTATQCIFQTNTIAALVPNDARKKRQIRAVLQAFAEQFGAALTSRLQAYCVLQKVRTVTAETLRTAAEELLGVGAASVPQGLAETALPSTMVYQRFRRSLAGLRLESSCSRIIGVVGFNFLRYVQDILERVYRMGEDAKNVELTDVVAALERPNVFSASGMPCIAYRHDPATVAAGSAASDNAEAAATTPAADVAAAAAAAAPSAEGAKKKARKSKKAAAVAEEAAPVEAAIVTEQVAAEAAPAAKKARGSGATTAGKKRERKEQTASAPAAEAVAAQAPVEEKEKAAPKKRSRKAAPAVPAQ